jgi:CBS domain-containing protein
MTHKFSWFNQPNNSQKEANMKIRDIMTRDIGYTTAEETIEQAAGKMKELNVGDVPVVVGGEAVGMLTDRDITIRIAALGLDPQKTHVSDAMTEGIVACREDEDVEVAARLMAEKQVRRLLVIEDGGKLAGVVSLGDLATSVDQELVGDVLKKISLPA